MKQTAVDWFYQRILAKDIKDAFKKAKEMEKEQIKKSFDIGFCEGYNYAIRDYNPFFIEGEEYYQETYGDK